MRRWWSIALLVGVSACAQQRPVLYPNAQYERVGREVAQLDIDTCMQLADAHVGNTGSAERTAKSAGAGAAVGSAVGAAVGAVAGRPGSGAAAGAAGGATGGFARGIFGSRKNDPIFRRFVEQCLRERGYAPIGWR